MSTKLTLSIEQEIIERAKSYAKDKNRSLSDLIENYLKSLVMEKSIKREENLNPIMKSLKGSFKDSKIDYKTELQKRLEKKYL